MALKTPPPTDEYRNGWDAIFGKKPAPQPPLDTTPEEEEAWQELEKKSS
jgi:hypothetical protein